MECVDLCIADRPCLSSLAAATALLVAASVGGDAACDVLHTCAQWTASLNDVRFDLRRSVPIHHLLTLLRLKGSALGHYRFTNSKSTGPEQRAAYSMLLGGS